MRQREPPFRWRNSQLLSTRLTSSVNGMLYSTAAWSSRRCICTGNVPWWSSCSPGSWLFETSDSSCGNDIVVSARWSSFTFDRPRALTGGNFNAEAPRRGRPAGRRAPAHEPVRAPTLGVGFSAGNRRWHTVHTSMSVHRSMRRPQSGHGGGMPGVASGARAPNGCPAGP